MCLESRLEVKWQIYPRGEELDSRETLCQCALFNFVLHTLRAAQIIHKGTKILFCHKNDKNGFSIKTCQVSNLNFRAKNKAFRKKTVRIFALKIQSMTSKIAQKLTFWFEFYVLPQCVVHLHNEHQHGKKLDF